MLLPYVEYILTSEIKKLETVNKACEKILTNPNLEPVYIKHNKDTIILHNDKIAQISKTLQYLKEN